MNDHGRDHGYVRDHDRVNDHGHGHVRDHDLYNDYDLHLNVDGSKYYFNFQYPLVHDHDRNFQNDYVLFLYLDLVYLQIIKNDYDYHYMIYFHYSLLQ